MYNRRQRRSLAKSVGFLNESSNEKWLERVQRSNEAGRQIDQQYKNQVETDIRNAAAERDARTLDNLTQSVGQEEAERIMANNKRLELDRLNKRLAKK